jgi:hypothetical protein
MECVDRAVAVFRKTEHVSTLAKSVIPLCSVLVFLRRFEEALTIFNEYQLECATHELLVEPIAEGVDRIYRDWLCRLIRHDLQIVGEDDPEIDLLLQTGSLTSGGQGDEERSVIYDYLRVFSRSVESVFIDMCVIKMASGGEHSYDQAMTLYANHTLNLESQCSKQKAPSFNVINTLLVVLSARSIPQSTASGKQRSDMCDTAAHLSAGWLALGEKNNNTPLGGYVSAVLIVVRDRLMSTEERNNDSSSSGGGEVIYAEGLSKLKEALGDEVFAQHEELFRAQLSSA